MRPLVVSILSSMLAACVTPHHAQVTGSAARTASPAPALERALSEIAARTDGHLGVAVIAVDDRSEVTAGTTAALPQQSTFKTWLAVAVADAVERGAIGWDDRVRIERSDLVYGYQPLASEVPPEGRALTVSELLRWSITRSDNPAADALVRHLGGADVVQATLAERGVEGVRVTTDVRGLQALGERLRRETDALDLTAAHRRVRAAVLDDPNPATALGAARSLARLARGELLGPDATTQLLSLHEAAETGRDRLRAGVPEGWRLAHKTGTGPDVAGLNVSTNDMGILTAPDGRRWAVAVFLSGSSAPRAQRDAVIADVARAVVAHAMLRTDGR